MKTIWQRIGSRSGPKHDSLQPSKVPVTGEWDEDRGQFISYKDKYGDVVWRRGRWENRYDKIEKKDVISFFFYGPGYFDYECTKLAYPVEEFGGME